VRYACIKQHVGEHAVGLMCRVLEVSTSGYFAWRTRAPSARAVSNERLTLEIRAVHKRSRQTYGSPRMHPELKAGGHSASLNRVARVMRANGICVKQRRKYVVTTDSAHDHPIADNVLSRQFSVAENPKPDRTWVSDITYIPTREGWLYLAVILDLSSRRVVGWCMKHTLDRSLALDALYMALALRVAYPGLVFHTDRGSQYASADHRALLSAHGMTCSMSRKGDCWDNAVSESFFATLKGELVDAADWGTREEARAAIFEYIEVWYNRERRHSSIGYVSPVEYETMLANEESVA
jgi:putative transposase